MAEWFSREGEVITLVLHVQPGARRSEIAGLHGTALKIRLAAPPVEGRANEALLRFVAGCFKVPPRNVEIRQGDQSRHKRVEVRGSTVAPESLLG
ncbi:MAG: YggU family protein [Nitrosomonadales bacterium]|nr:YggU family protein [Nitrosomonadales bacterium]